MRLLPRYPSIVTLIALPLLLALVAACGGTAQPEETTTGQPAATPMSGDTAVAAATVAPETAMAEVPTGTLTVGQKELGPFMGHPSLTGNPQIFLVQTAPIVESLLTVSSDLKPVGMLAKSWDVSDDGSTWTFQLIEGVQFHKGYGEMTAEDVIWSMRQFGAEGSKHPRASNIRGTWENENGHAKAIDDYTVEVDTGDPWSEVPIQRISDQPVRRRDLDYQQETERRVGCRRSQRTDRRHRLLGPGGVPYQ